MPLHAKILTGCLAFNVFISLLEFALASPEASVMTLAIRVLLLLGFLKGSEGVRLLLQIGAFASVIIGAAVLVAAIPLLSLGGLGMLVLLAAVLPMLIGFYMLWALRDPAVQAWMLNRSLGGALDD